MERNDERQQEECEAERMAHNLECLERIAKAGLPEVAKDLASELGLSEQFNRKGESNAANR